jgi:PKD repeat protein
MRRLKCALIGFGLLAAALALGGCDEFWPLEAGISVLNSATGYVPLSVQFYDASLGPVSSRTWDFGDPTSGTNNTSTLESPTHMYTEHDAYLVTLTVFSSDGRSSQATAVVRAVNPPPVARLDVTPDHGPVPLAVVFNLSTSFDPAGIVPAPTGSIVSFNFDFGDGSAPTTGTDLGAPISHTYATPGYRVATLTVVDNDGASASATHPVTVEGVVATLAAPGGDPIGLAHDGSSLWVSDSTTKRIYKIRPSDGQVVASFDAPGGSIAIMGEKAAAKNIVPGPTAGTPAGIAWGNGALWVACISDGKIYQVNPNVPTTDPGHVLAVLDSDAFTAFGVAFGGGALWVSDLGTGRILKVDPFSGAVLGSFVAPSSLAASVGPRGIVPVAPTGLAWANGALWVSAGITLYRVDPATGAVLASAAAPGPTPAGLAFDGVYLWVADPNGANPGRLDRLVVP